MNIEVILRRGIKGTSSWTFTDGALAEANVKALESFYGLTASWEKHGERIRYIIDASDWTPEGTTPNNKVSERRRFRNALGIQLGAINPSGICHSILEACREVSTEGGSTQDDPAIRLMVHQLAFICKVDQIDNTPNEYGELTKACKKAVRELEWQP